MDQPSRILAASRGLRGPAICGHDREAAFDCEGEVDAIISRAVDKPCEAEGLGVRQHALFGT